MMPRAYHAEAGVRNPGYLRVSKRLKAGRDDEFLLRVFQEILTIVVQ